jgi:hypothetical protein
MRQCSTSVSPSNMAIDNSAAAFWNSSLVTPSGRAMSAVAGQPPVVRRWTRIAASTSHAAGGMRTSSQEPRDESSACAAAASRKRPMAAGVSDRVGGGDTGEWHPLKNELPMNAQVSAA